MNPDRIILGILYILCGIFCMGVAFPLLKRRVEPNKWYGVRFKKAFQSDDLWYRINEHGGRQMIIWSAIIILAGIIAMIVPMQKNDPLFLFLAFTPLGYLIGAVVTYRYAQRL